jgi:hypothetical protein
MYIHIYMCIYTQIHDIITLTLEGAAESLALVGFTDTALSVTISEGFRDAATTGAFEGCY